MVAFHDRRRASFETVEEFPGLALGPGDTLSKRVRGGRFVVQGVQTEEGRRFLIQEALPNGQTITHGSPYHSRREALKDVGGMRPTNTYEIL